MKCSTRSLLLLLCLLPLFLLQLRSSAFASDTYVEGYYWRGSSTPYANFSARTMMEAFSGMWAQIQNSQSGDNYPVLLSDPNKDSDTSYIGQWQFCSWRGCASPRVYSITLNACGASTAEYCQPLPEPECPDSGTPFLGDPLTSGTIGSGYTDADGCSLVPVYSPTSCDYQGGAADECLRFDGYQYGDNSPEPPKDCYTTTGQYIGQVSANMSCPTSPETKCYNPDGTLAYIVDSSTSCPANTSPENKPDTTETDSDIDPETGEPTGEKTTDKTESTTTSTETVTNPDGSVTTTTTTTTTRGDGSTSTTTNTKTEHPDGTTTETTETAGTEVEDASTVSGGDSCSVEPTCEGDPLQCYQIKQQWRDSCGKNQHLQNLACDSGNFICEGSPIDCYMVRLRRDAACEAQDAEGVVKAIQDGIASGAIEFEGTDEWGQLNALDQGEFNVAEQFDIASIWKDNGNQGSCPPPLAFSLAAGGSLEFSFQPMCDLAVYIRALVILTAMWISGSMIAQVLAGTRYTH